MDTRTEVPQEVNVPSEHVAVVAMFSDRGAAEEAVDGLLASGFADDQISLVARGAGADESGKFLPGGLMVTVSAKGREVDAERVLREHDRTAERVGWFDLVIAGVDCRLAVTRLLEPGVPKDSLQIFFRDLTTGEETYGLGRYLDLEEAGEGSFVVDFNRAYNPACAYSPHYNCPVPPNENRLVVAITAGEMTPR